MKRKKNLEKGLWIALRRMLLFIGEKMGLMSFARRHALKRKTEQKSRLYATINDISVFEFSECLKGNFEYLYKEKGKRIPWIEKDVFEDLYTQYCEELNDVSHYSDLKEIYYHISKIRILESAIGLIQNKDDCKYLKGSLFYFGIKITGKKEIDLSNIRLNLNRAIRKYNNLIRKLEDEKKKHSEPKDSNLLESLVFISTFHKYHIPDTISVKRYCDHLKQLEKEIKRQEKHGRHNR